LQSEPKTIVLQEPRATRIEQATCGDLLARIAAARNSLRSAGLTKGDRVVLLAANSIDWAACNMAVLAEGLVHVPLYTRQDPRELAQMIDDCGASLVLCGNEELRAALTATGASMPPMELIADLIEPIPAGTAQANGTPRSPGRVASHDSPLTLDPQDTATIIYTSGTSGVSKGVVLSVANLDHMLPCTMERLDELMGGKTVHERVFHYLPFCFAGSWILLLTSLTRRSHLTLGTDLDKLADHMALAGPHYFLNVPILLDRIRRGVEDKMAARGGVIKQLFDAALQAWARKQANESRGLDALWLSVANLLLFAKVRQKISPNLRALICGSAPLSKETQLFFEMMGITVLQVYGLTETTAICTMDKPSRPRRAGCVGLAIPGIEMKTGDRSEILVRGPHIFQGYWRRPEETSACMQEGWFRTGDQGEVDVDGNWRIIGRVKSVIVLSSGHNVEPDAIEAKLQDLLADAEQVVLIGHERPHLTVLIAGPVRPEDAERALGIVNETLPHYKRVRGFHVRSEPFTIENGFLTANGKLKRQRVLHEHHTQIEAMYAVPAARK
jgi:long-chain acyl-CoA synthetase